MFFKEKKGQGALEYLLLIGGVILVAVLVITLIVSLAGSGSEEAGAALTDAEINRGILACKTDYQGLSCQNFCSDEVFASATTDCCGNSNAATECVRNYENPSTP